MKSLLNTLGIFLIVGALMAVIAWKIELRETPAETKLSSERDRWRVAAKAADKVDTREHETYQWCVRNGGYVGTPPEPLAPQLYAKSDAPETTRLQLAEARAVRWHLARNAAIALTVFAVLSFILAALRPTALRPPA